MKIRISALALAAGVALASCGSDSESAATEGAAPRPSLDEAKAVVLDYFTKAFAGDPAACEHESQAFATELNELNATADCVERVEAVKEMIPEGEPFIDISRSTVAVEADGDGATAVVTHELEGFGGTYRMVVVGGVWRLDGEIGTHGDGGGSTGTDPVRVPEQEAEEIAAVFCLVEVGVTRNQVESWMGEAGEEQVDDDGQTELSWYVNQDSYTVWFDEQDQVASLSSSTPREVDACAQS
ncbi:hypothetical protein NODU109028_11545 [Nocardioides dubius]|uniref:Lipoprotein n=1 Tax=Nocardioides dubius TaxID=317019 RepID=A0ABN1TRT4_9ACTN